MSGSPIRSTPDGESQPFLFINHLRTVLAVKGSLRRANTARPGLLRAVREPIHSRERPDSENAPTNPHPPARWSALNGDISIEA